ncbi:MAG: epoxyqueuosine reductase [Deltaproteobacteria bacterium]|nr:epoxyqueuosine reductase [Deltaproteobacteria bacterium]MBF0507643.1 epoxyqueuosine reductase [Deltaproteobacteria bacterium]MBF0525112.1 epoxyqueuosine reductase [Deltaproteobacteria bacterium]
MDYTNEMKKTITAWGADLVGIADVEGLAGIRTNPVHLLDSFTRAISIAVQLPVSVFEMISDQPIPIYAAIYQTVNRLLDEIAFKTSRKLQSDGYLSLPIPASQVLDRENWYAAISHKAVARLAGLGWQGKNLLLITPEYGSRVRLVTVLTNAPLECDRPVKNLCGKCNNCQEACPVGAIKGISTEDHYKSRNEALHFQRCVEKLTGEFAKIPDIGAPICGICIKVCPFGLKIKKNKSNNNT